MPGSSNLDRASSIFEKGPKNTPASGASASISWGLPFLTFELCSNDPAVLARAEIIFRPWRSARSLNPIRHWSVEPADGDNEQLARHWKVRSGGNGAPLFAHSVAHAVMMVEFLAIQALIEHCDGFLSFHGALVEKHGKGALILGRGESGKSTLVCALWRRGWTLLGDDITLVDLAAGSAYPAPRRVALRYASRKLFGEELWARILAAPSCDETTEGYLFHPDEIDTKKRSASTRLSTVIFLQRRENSAAPAILERLEPAHALLAFLPYLNLIQRLDFGEAIRCTAPFADAVPAYDLGRGPLEKMAQSLERLLESDC